MKSKDICLSFSNIDDLKLAIEIAESYSIEIIDIIIPAYLGIRKTEYKGSLIGITSFIFSIVALLLVIYFQWWSSSIDYPLNIGGREFFSWVFSIPIAYELTILFAAIGVFVSYSFLTKLPRWHNADSSFYNMRDELMIIVSKNDNINDFLSKINYINQKN